MNLTIGLLIIAALFMFMAFKLDDKHVVLKVIGLVFSVLSMLLLSGHLLGTEDYCETIVRNQTGVDSYTTAYGYDRQCFTYTQTTGLTTFKLMNYFVRIMGWYIIFVTIYIGLDFLNFNILDRLKMRFSGEKK